MGTKLSLQVLHLYKVRCLLATLSVTAYSTVTMLLAFFHEVAQRLQMLKCLRGAWSSTCSKNTMLCIGVCFNESTSISKVSDWSFSICASLFLVDYVGIHHHYFHNPKKILSSTTSLTYGENYNS